MSYICPRIDTDDYYAQQTQFPDPLSWELGNVTRQTIDVPAEPIHMHAPYLGTPDVPWHAGWRAALIDWPESKLPFAHPLEAPQVSYGTGGYVPQVLKAAKPDPTTTYTGVRSQLRAPGINEGYSL